MADRTDQVATDCENVQLPPTARQGSGNTGTPATGDGATGGGVGGGATGGGASAESATTWRAVRVTGGRVKRGRVAIRVTTAAKATAGAGCWSRSPPVAPSARRR
jgi:hypothetical protein